METKVSGDQAMDKLPGKRSSGLLVQEEHGFQKGGKYGPWPQDKKMPGLDWVNRVHANRPAC